ncbi:MAG: hypothetical protein WBP31_15530 [Chitinophagales bacterium]|jgi:uncharacterized protein YoxC|nr:hypothetical protein [Bacteroidota bacterium]MBL0280264.1 hypothetical protein [Bacteroidota bacterium]MBP8249919.1 hypothetical protein [Chitinophagales bacterium]MBP9881538.1 hypothetical protein [Chitinophagales bacterium]
MLLLLALPSGIEFLVVSLVSVIIFLAPIVGCIYLFMRVKKLKKEIEKLQQKVAGLEKMELKHPNENN